MDDRDFLNWLLEAETPSIKYLTLRNLLGQPDANDGVQAVWKEMKNDGPIPVILAGQTEAGHWAGEHSYYTPKYSSTHWSMMLLAELAADGADSRMQKGASFMLEDTWQELEKQGKKGIVGISCFWGNFLRYVLHCGYVKDQRVATLVEKLACDALEGAWRCSYNDDKPCAWGAVRALWGLARIPESARSSHTNEAIQSGLRFLLEEHSLVDADYPVKKNGKVHSIWARLNFPLFYQADILFVLRVAAELGALEHPGAQPAVAWLKSRRNRNERWRGASPYRQRTWRALGSREETNRWVSLQAAMVLEGRG